MDWENIIALVLGGGGIIGMLIQGVLNRRVTRAQAEQIKAQSKQADEQANATNANYAGIIIEQSNKRVEQAFADTERMRQERDRWQEECRGQRKAKQEWRGKHEEAVARIHELELANKDKDATIAELSWHECRRNDHDCNRRIPPRNRETSAKN